MRDLVTSFASFCLAKTLYAVRPSPRRLAPRLPW